MMHTVMLNKFLVFSDSPKDYLSRKNHYPDYVSGMIPCIAFQLLIASMLSVDRPARSCPDIRYVRVTEQ